MKINKKGFTMVELLATIVILGLLVGVAIGAVSWILDSSEKNFYESLEKNLLLAAENYYADHRGALPKAIGQSRKLSLNTLVKTNYMKKDSIVDYGKSPCNLDSSYVQVIKYSKKDYIYTLHLECPAKKIDHEKEALNSLKVSVTLDWQPKAIESSKANIKITVDGAVSKIASYQYTIYKNGQVAYNSSSISAGSVDSVNKSIALKNYVPGAIRFVVTAYDIHGNSKTAMVSDSIYNNDVPDCGNVTPVFDIKNDKDWENDKNASRKLSIRCIDTDTRCVRSKFSKTFKDDMVEGYITIEGTNGKTRVCPATVMIDKTAPVCGSNTGVKTWTASDRVVRVNCSDATSGCTNNSFSKTYNTANKVVITDNITIKDKASNTKSCPVDVYVDKEKPKCGAITGASTSWTTGDRTITVACSDGSGSGCKQASYSKTFNTTTKTANITIEDKVGNKTNCPVNVYVDKEAPKCGSITGASTSWTKNNRTISVACSDGSGSGCSKTSFSQTFGSTTKTANITISDKAGRTTNCPVNVYVDKTNPSCSISKSTNSTVESLTLTVNGSDAHSGVSSYSWSSASSGFSSTRTKSISSNGTYSAWVKDAAGNVGGCSISVSNIQNIYKIYYNLNGGYNNPSNPSSYRAGTTTPLYNPTRPNYAFAGWYTNSGLTNQITSISSSQKGDITLYAKWSPIAPSCNGVSGNSGSWTTSRTVTVGCKNPDGSACSPVNGTYTSNGAKSLTIRGSNGATATCSFTVYNVDSGTPSLGDSGYWSTGSQAPDGRWYGGYFYQHISMTASGYRHSGSYIKVQGKQFNSGGSQRTGYGCAEFPVSEFRHWRSSVHVSQSARVCNNAGRCSGEKSF